jgi:hypothetical protein
MRFLERSLVTNRIPDYAECVDTDPLPRRRFRGVLGIIRCSALWVKEATEVSPGTLCPDQHLTTISVNRSGGHV